MCTRPKGIGIVGYGNLGKYLCNFVRRNEEFSLSFVWSRNSEHLLDQDFEESQICLDLEDVSKFGADLIVEVAHPSISEKYGALFLQDCDYMVGSPSALANQHTEDVLREAAKKHGLYIPAGALWGGMDIAKMADENTLKALKITMKKHPSCFRLESPLRELNRNVLTNPVTLYDGPVRQLCFLAPNNVNTMAAAAIAAHSLGFDGVQGRLVSDPNLQNWHIVEMEVTGPSENGKSLKVKSVRENPANLGAVTGTATFGSFLSSVKQAGGKGPGVHLC